MTIKVGQFFFGKKLIITINFIKKFKKFKIIIDIKNFATLYILKVLIYLIFWTFL